MNIELKKPNRVKEFWQKVKNRAEDIMFALALKLPEKMLTGAVSDWLGKYMEKRAAELQGQIIRQKWQNMALEQAVEQIHQKQYRGKAPED